MEVGIVALGLGALGIHFGNKEEPIEKPKEKYLNNTNNNNDQTIYNHQLYDSVQNYVQKKADQHFEKSLDPVNTNIIPSHLNDIPHEELFQNLDLELQQKAEQIYNKTIESKENNNIPPNAVNNFSNNEFFQNTEKKNFSHNNMVPFFGGSIKQNTNEFITQTKLENFTGQFENDRTSKVEVENMFEPTKDTSFVDGMPSFDFRDRYNGSNYKQGEKLMDEIKVGPGLNIGSDIQHGGEGFHSTWRPQYKGIDELRVSSNPQVSYEGRTVDGIAQSKVKRSALPNVKHYSPETYWEDMNLERVFTTIGDQVKEMYRSKQIVPDTNRQETTREYSGVAKYENDQLRDMEDQPTVKPSFKNEQKNCNMGIIKSVTEFISTGVGKSAFNLPENQRDSTAINNFLNSPKASLGSDYVQDPCDKPNPTIKESTVCEVRQGHLGTEYKNTVYDPNDLAKLTTKQTTVEEVRQGHIGTEFKNTVYDPNDLAKMTTKQTTVEEVRNGHLGTERKNTVYDPNDLAKMTTKQTTVEEVRNGHLGTERKNIVYDPNDLAKMTIKQTTVEEVRNGNLGTEYKNTVYDPNDLAKMTTKETTVEEVRNGHIGTEYKNTVYDPNDLAKMTTKETTVEEVRNGHIGAEYKNTVYDPNDLAKMTTKETTVEEVRNGHIGAEYKNTVYDPNDLAKITTKQTTVEDVREGHFGGENKNIVYDPNDLARTTTKQTTVEDVREGHLGGENKNTVYDPNDTTRTTIKQTTVEDVREGHLGGENKNTVYDPNDTTRTTIKQTTVEEVREGHLGGEIRNTVYDPDDITRTTIKQTTVEEVREGHIASINEKHIVYDPDDVAKTTQKHDLSDNAYAGNPGENIMHVSYDNMYNARVPDKKEIVSKGRDPTKQGIKNASGGEDINVRFKCLDNYYKDRKHISTRNISQERTKVKLTRFGKDLKQDDRLDGCLLDAFNQNPYTQSLNSYY